jgi:hypothetical protein
VRAKGRARRPATGEAFGLFKKENPSIKRKIPQSEMKYDTIPWPALRSSLGKFRANVPENHQRNKIAPQENPRTKPHDTESPRRPQGGSGDSPFKFSKINKI